MDRSTSIFPKSKISLKKLKNYDMKIIKKDARYQIQFRENSTKFFSDLSPL